MNPVGLAGNPRHLPTDDKTMWRGRVRTGVRAERYSLCWYRTPPTNATPLERKAVHEDHE